MSEELELMPYILLDGGGHFKDFIKASSQKKAAEAFLRRRKGRPFPASWVVLQRDRLRKSKNLKIEPLDSSPQVKQKFLALVQHVEKVQRSAEEMLDVLKEIKGAWGFPDP